MDRVESSPPAERVGRFRIERRLGAGGMGVVYLGRDDATGQLAAVKLIRAEYATEPQLRSRLRREVAAAIRVPRFCTAPVLDSDLEADRPWIATEFVDAPTLDAALLERGPLAGDALVSFAAGVAVALRAIHQHGVVHRDLKPSNILLTQLGPRVIDFGIALVDGAWTQLTRAGAMLGTPAHMAPEQLRGDPVTTAADVFAWGGLVVYAATGQPPFGRGLPLAGIIHEPPNLGNLAGPLRALVAETLAKDPAARPTSSQLVERLSAIAPAATTQVLEDATTAPPPRPARRRRRRRRRIAAATALSATAAVAITAGVLVSVRADEPDSVGDAVRAAELAAESHANTGTDQREAMRLALDAWDEAETAPARSALLGAATLPYAGRLGSGPGGASVAVNPSGTLIAVGDLDGSVRLWDVASREPVGEPLTGHQSTVYWIQFSPDGSLLATGSLDADDRGLAGVRVWEVPTGRLVRTLPGISSVVWSSDGRSIIAAALPLDEQGEVVPSLAVWEVGSWRNLATFPTGELVSDTAVSPDGAWVAGSRGDGSVGVWRIDDGELVAELPAGDSETEPGTEGAGPGADDSDELVRVAFAPTGELARVDLSGEISLWELPEPAEPLIIDDGSTRTVGRLQFTPDGYLVATGAGTAVQWLDPAGGPQGGRLIGFEGTPLDMAVSADGKLVVATGVDGPTTMWRRATYRLPHQQVVTDVGFHPDGGRLVTTTTAGTVQEWDVEVPEVVARLRHPDTVGSVAYAPDGTRASVSVDGTLRVIGPTGAERARLRIGEGREPHEVHFSPDGKLLAVAASPPFDPPETSESGHRIFLWDTDTLDRHGTLDLGAARAHAITFTPDGLRLLAAIHRGQDPVLGTSGESTLRRWRVADLAEESAVDLGEQQAVHLAVSPDGETVAIGGADQAVQLHHLTGDRAVREFASHPAPVRQLAFSPDGEVLATVTTDDPLVRLWEVESGDLLATLTGHLDAPNALAFSPDGQTLATGGPDGDVMLWPTEPERAITRICDALRDGPSPEEPIHRLCR